MLVRNIVKQGLLLRNAAAASRVAAYHDHGHHEHSTMNDLPVPAGDWQEQNSRQNAKYNTILAVGILAFIGTVSFARSSGLVHLNYSPPTLD